MLSSIILSENYDTGIVENSISSLTSNTIILCSDHYVKSNLSRHMSDNLRGINGLVLSRYLKSSEINVTDEDSNSLFK